MGQFFPVDPPAGLPEFATNDVVDPLSGENNVVEPGASQKSFGWFPFRKKPERNIMNWLHRLTYVQLHYWAITFYNLIDGAMFWLSTSVTQLDLLLPISVGESTLTITGGLTGGDQDYIVKWKKYADKIELILPEFTNSSASVNDIYLYDIPEELQYQGLIDKGTILFDADFVTGNVINMDINGVPILPITYSIDQANTISAIATAISIVEIGVITGTPGGGTRDIIVLHTTDDVEITNIVNHILY